MWLKLKFYVMAHYEKIFLLFGFTNNYKKIVVLHNFSFMEKNKIVILDVEIYLFMRLNYFWKTVCCNFVKWAEVSVVIICLNFKILRLVYFLYQQVFKHVCQKVSIFLIVSKLALPIRKDTIHNKWAVQEGSTIDFWIDKILTLKARFSKWYNSFRINLTNTICLLNKKEIKVNNKLHFTIYWMELS